MTAAVQVSYTFHAPRDIVFQAFTDSNQLRDWWGPKGWPFHVAAFEARQGGIFHYSQTSPEGDVMWVKFEYVDVRPSEKIEYISFFSDAEGNAARAPFHENWPMATRHTLTFEERDGTTEVTMIAEPVSPTEEELRTFEDSLDMIREGFAGTFAQLAERLQ